MDAKAGEMHSLITGLDLQPHPEGGWYKEMYRSPERIPADALPARYTSGRSLGTSIYYLLGKDDFSAFHRIQSDELWYFLKGDPLELLVLMPDGKLRQFVLGLDKPDEICCQLSIPARHWFAARLMDGGHYALVGTAVVPGFDFADFEMGEAEMLVKEFPDHAGLIRQLCRK